MDKKDDVYKEIEKILAEAEQWVKENHSKYKNPAVVLDIDKTSLDGSYRTEYGYPPFKSMIKLYQLLISLNVDIFFITSRPAEVSKETIENLEKAGYNKYKKVFFQIPTVDYVQSKIDNQKKIIEEGHTIIINIGDREEDLKGDYAIKIYKMPSYSTEEEVDTKEYNYNIDVHPISTTRKYVRDEYRQELNYDSTDVDHLFQ